MPKATETSTTTRRGALRGLSLAALTTGLTASARATEEPAADAELVAACDRLLAVDAAIGELMSQRTTIEQEHATDPVLTTLFARRTGVEEELYDFDVPTTQAGAAALARATLSGWLRDDEGEIVLHDFEDWGAVVALEFLAGGSVA